MKSEPKALKSLITVAVASVIFAAIKLYAFFLTGSLLVLTSALDSVSDTFLSLINARLSKASLSKPDKEHPYGHGGIEVIGSLIQGIIIFSIGVSIILETILRLYRRSSAAEINLDEFPIAIGILAFSSIAALLNQYILDRARKNYSKLNRRSLALDADHAHYRGDALVNALSAAGLLLVYYSRQHQLDTLFGFIGGLVFIGTALPILNKVFNDILHKELNVKTQQEVVDIIYRTSDQIMGVHRLRSRTLGPTFFIDFHLKIPHDLSVQEGHDLGEKVVKNIKEKYPFADIIIHLDPDTEPDDDFWQPSYR